MRRVIVFDVNETLSDMAPIQLRFAAVGALALLAVAWLASVLRDGFALTAMGANPSFAELATEAARASLTRLVDDVHGACPPQACMSHAGSRSRPG